jgi:hypothetical protein
MRRNTSYVTWETVVEDCNPPERIQVIAIVSYAWAGTTGRTLLYPSQNSGTQARTNTRPTTVIVRCSDVTLHLTSQWVTILQTSSHQEKAISTSLHTSALPNRGRGGTAPGVVRQASEGA